MSSTESAKDGVQVSFYGLSQLRCKQLPLACLALFFKFELHFLNINILLLEQFEMVQSLAFLLRGILADFFSDSSYVDIFHQLISFKSALPELVLVAYLPA